ncbi:unnamed protein product, partial [Closterium sp. NIES-53]
REAGENVHSRLVKVLFEKSIAVKRIAVKSIAVKRIAVKSIAVKSIAVKSIAVKRIAVKSIAVKSIAVKRIAVKSIAVKSIAGVLEAIRMCSAGYPTRRLFDDFIDRFSLLVPSLFDKEMSDPEYVEVILRHAKLENYQIGKSKIFLRAGQMALMETCRLEIMNAAAARIQRATRRFLFRLHRARAALCIQKLWRAYTARVFVHHLRQRLAATCIQRMERGRQQRMRFLVLRRAAITIQAKYRMHLYRMRYLHMRDNLAATHIQCHWRGYVVRKPWKAMRQHFFARLARLRYKNLKLEATRIAELAPPRKKTEVAMDTIRMMVLRVQRDKAEKGRQALERQLAEAREEVERRGREIAARGREIARLQEMLDAEQARAEAAEAEVREMVAEREEQREEQQQHLVKMKELSVLPDVLSHTPTAAGAGAAGGGGGFGDGAAARDEVRLLANAAAAAVTAVAGVVGATEAAGATAGFRDEAGGAEATAAAAAADEAVPAATSTAPAPATSPVAGRVAEAAVMHTGPVLCARCGGRVEASGGIPVSPSSLRSLASPTSRRPPVSPRRTPSAAAAAAAAADGASAAAAIAASIDIRADHERRPVQGEGEGEEGDEGMEEVKEVAMEGDREKECVVVGADLVEAEERAGNRGNDGDGNEEQEDQGQRKQQQAQEKGQEQVQGGTGEGQGEAAAAAGGEEHKGRKPRPVSPLSAGASAIRDRLTLDVGAGSTTSGAAAAATAGAAAGAAPGAAAGAGAGAAGAGAGAAASVGPGGGAPLPPSDGSRRPMRPRAASSSGSNWQVPSEDGDFDHEGGAAAAEQDRGPLSADRGPLSSERPRRMSTGAGGGGAGGKEFGRYGSSSFRGSPAREFEGGARVGRGEEGSWSGRKLGGVGSRSARSVASEASPRGGVGMGMGTPPTPGGSGAGTPRGKSLTFSASNFDKILASMQREVEIAQKMREENNWLRAAYKEAVHKAEVAAALAGAERARAEEAERNVAAREEEMREALARCHELQEKLLGKSREVRTLSQRLIAFQASMANANPAMPIDKQQEVLLNEIAVSRFPFGPQGQPVAACVVYRSLLHWRVFQAEKTNAFDRIIETFQMVSRSDDMSTLSYWLSNHVVLLYLVQPLAQQPRGAAVPPAPAEKPKLERVTTFGFFGARPPTPPRPSATMQQVDLMLFKQQLATGIERLYVTIRDSAKTELAVHFNPQARGTEVEAVEGAEPRENGGGGAGITSCWARGRGRGGRAPQRNAATAMRKHIMSSWTNVVITLRHIIGNLVANHVPAALLDALIRQLLFFVNMKIFNSLMVRAQWCPCTYSNGEMMEEGLSRLEQWVHDVEVQLREVLGGEREPLRKELRHLQQTILFLTLDHKPRRTLEELRMLCPDLSMNQLVHMCIWYEDDKYGTKGVDPSVIEQMWSEMVDDSPMLLRDGEGIPFTTDEIVHSLPEINLDEVEPPPDLQDDPTFHFLLPLTSIPSVPSTPTAASHTPRNASPHLPPPSVPSSIPRSASLSHAHSRPGTAPAPHPMGGTPRGTGVSSVTSTPRVPSSPWDYFRGRGAWKSDDA